MNKLNKWSLLLIAFICLAVDINEIMMGKINLVGWTITSLVFVLAFIKFNEKTSEIKKIDFFEQEL